MTLQRPGCRQRSNVWPAPTTSPIGVLLLGGPLDGHIARMYGMEVHGYSFACGKLHRYEYRHTPQEFVAVHMGVIS